jgi:hypothetical protein
MGRVRYCRPSTAQQPSRRSGQSSATVVDLRPHARSPVLRLTAPSFGTLGSATAGKSGGRIVEQQIQFATTQDGVSLAYATVGSGPPLVKAANWLSHLEFDWQSPIWRHWLEGLARHLLVRYDERGCGLSEWDVEDFSFEAWVRDLEAVVDAAGAVGEDPAPRGEDPIAGTAGGDRQAGRPLPRLEDGGAAQLGGGAEALVRGVTTPEPEVRSWAPKSRPRLATVALPSCRVASSPFPPTTRGFWQQRAVLPVGRIRRTCPADTTPGNSPPTPASMTSG